MYSAWTARVVDARSKLQFLLLGGLRVLGGDEAVLLHPLDDVVLTRPRPVGVDDGIECRRRLRQACQHRRLGDGEVLHGLAEVGVRRRGEAIGPVAQENLVHVDLEDLVLGQQVLELEGEQYFVELAGKGLFRGQVHVAGDLHGDGRRALAFRTPQVGQARAQQPAVVDSAMRIEARVLDGQNRVLHHFGDLGYRSQVAPLLAEFADQHALSRKDTQGQLGTVVGQVRDVGQIGIGHRESDARDDD